MGLSYQWQRKAPQSVWAAWGLNSPTLTLPGITRADNGCQFRCVITDGNGKTVITDAVTLTVI